MARRRGKKKPPTRRELALAYHEKTRGIGQSLVLVLPLLAAYEVVLALLDPPLRNSAELAFSEFVGRLPRSTLDAGRLALLACLGAAGLMWLFRRRPQVTAGHWVLLEAFAFAVVLGPLLGWLVGGLGLSATGAPLEPTAPSWLPWMLSVGAGLWEELVFRLGLLGGTAFLLGRITPWRAPAIMVVALISSSLIFALYHHVGAGGEPLSLDRFAFRTIAGILLGLVFATRGLAVVVYMHVFYDLLCDLRMAAA
jgi:hypothetical protein